MLIFDQFRRNDASLRLLAAGVFGGLSILLAGLWWVQVVRSRDYQAHQETQSYRTVRTPSVRGAILDRNGVVLAESRPRFTVSLYLEELRRHFEKAYVSDVKRLRAERDQLMVRRQQQLGRELTKQELKALGITPAERTALRWTTRYAVASNLVTHISHQIRQPAVLDWTNFVKHYKAQLPMPYPVVENLDPKQIARFQEQCAGLAGADMEMQTFRIYPRDTLAGHVLGFVRRDDSSAEGEEASFFYRLPDFTGIVGIEGRYDRELRGRAGAKSVLVNSAGFRQSETIWTATEPGQDVVLTIDARLQEAAEKSLRLRAGPEARGAVVVMDVRNGDLLALASSPPINPNYFVRGLPPEQRQREWQRMNDPILRPQINRATQENYAPGSIFKTLVGLACLESGLNEAEEYRVEPYPGLPEKGVIIVDGRKIKDLVLPGPYNFRRALLKSSNAYFIHHGLAAGMPKIIELARQLHLGESTRVMPRVETATRTIPRQESPGIFPTLAQVSSGWYKGDTANICIGQGKMAVTPLQMAVMTSALANGGKVFWPRLVARLDSRAAGTTPGAMDFVPGQLRDHLRVSAGSMGILHRAMLADTEDPEGTGRSATVPGLRICGKTGTAQVEDQHGKVVDQNLWFISFAPFEQPRYAVVVLVEGEGSGGGTCAPVAHDIYSAILRLTTARADTLATNP